MKNTETAVGNDSDHSEAQPGAEVGVPDIVRYLGGALKHVEPRKPLILIDGYVTTDSGYMVSNQYVDIGVTKLHRRPSIPVKAIEAEYGLEQAPNLQVSAPHRFRDYGETFVQNDQEGRADRQAHITTGLELRTSSR